MRKSILIADDNASVRRALRDILESEPKIAVCSEAVDGSDAVQKASECHPDLIILDHVMPVMNGLDAAQQLKVLLPNVPVLMFTSEEVRLLDVKAHACGITEVIPKDASIDVLLGKIKALLGLGPALAASASARHSF